MSGPSASEAPRKSRGGAAADAGTNTKSNARAKSNADIDAKTTILAAGCFDLLHYGHLRYLEEAKRLGGDGAFLVVVVARDSTIIKRKGRPR